MDLEATFIVKFNTGPHRKDENFTPALIFSDRVAILPLLMSQIGLLFTFVMRCLMMFPDAIFIVKLNSRLKTFKNFT